MSATTAAQKARVLSEVGLSLSSSVSTLPSLAHWGRNQKNEKRNPRKLKKKKTQSMEHSQEELSEVIEYYNANP